jgi:ABC-type phosphate transport system substrate-binding protein
MSRRSKNVRGIVLVSSLTATMAILAACTPPMPPDVLAARAESQIVCGTGSLEVATPGQFIGAIDSVGAALNSVCPEQMTTEVPIDAPALVKLVERTPNQQLITEFQTASCPNDKIIVIPAFAYPVTIAYNVVGLEGLVFTPEAVAAILKGEVTSWEDPLIADENPDYDLTLLPDIALMSLETPDGSVEAMTTWLTQQVPNVWTEGVTGTLTAGQKFATQEDLLLEMTSVESSIAVLPIFTAFNNVLATANLPVKGTDANGKEIDTVVTTDDVQLYKVGSGATNVTTDETGNIFAGPAVGGFPVEGNFDLASSKIVLGEDQGLVGWPVEGYAHLLICDDGTDSALPLLFAQYAVRLAGQGSLESFGLTPMPEPIRVQTFTPLRVTVNTEDADMEMPDEAPLEEAIVDEEITNDELPQEAESAVEGQ